MSEQFPMKTMTVAAEIAPDGTLHLELPTGLPPGPADVVVVVQPKSIGPTPSSAKSCRDVRLGAASRV